MHAWCSSALLPSAAGAGCQRRWRTVAGLGPGRGRGRWRGEWRVDSVLVHAATNSARESLNPWQEHMRRKRHSWAPVIMLRPGATAEAAVHAGRRKGAKWWAEIYRSATTRSKITRTTGTNPARFGPGCLVMTCEEACRRLWLGGNGSMADSSGLDVTTAGDRGRRA